MSVIDIHEYQKGINAVLDLLKQSGKVSWCELDREESSQIAVFYHITIPSLGRKILVKFTLWSGDKNDSSTNFISVELPGHPQILSAEKIRDMILRAISAREKGEFHERVIGQVLEILEKQEVIRGYAKARDEDDINGVDFTVYFLNVQGIDTEMPLQVKSSIAGQRNHAKAFPDIPSICIKQANWTGREAALEHLKQIILAYRKSRTDILHL